MHDANTNEYVCDMILLKDLILYLMIKRNQIYCKKNMMNKVEKIEIEKQFK